MREVLFRGKRKDNGEWVYGYYLQIGDVGKLHYILTGKLAIRNGIVGFEQYEVIPESVSEFTGLTDKNGNKIFEGDIVEIGHSIHHYREDDFPETYRPRRAHSWHWNDEQKAFLYKRNYVVEWKQKDAKWILRNGSDQHDSRETILYFHNGVIIGNIHDNPELLKGGAE